MGYFTSTVVLNHAHEKIRRGKTWAAMDGRAPAIGRRHHQVLADYGRVLMLLGTIVITHQLGLSEAAPSNAGHLLLAFIVWLLGAALAMLSVVARRFPGSRPPALRNYLLGGL